jgi:hypothetical protein
MNQRNQNIISLLAVAAVILLNCLPEYPRSQQAAREQPSAPQYAQR